VPIGKVDQVALNTHFVLTDRAAVMARDFDIKRSGNILRNLIELPFPLPSSVPPAAYARVRRSAPPVRRN